MNAAIKEKFKQLGNRILDAVATLISKIVEIPINFVIKAIDFVYTMILKMFDVVTNIVNAITTQLSSFKGALWFVVAIAVIIDVTRKDNNGVVNFVLTKVTNMITTIAEALQISGGVLIGGAIVVLIFLMALKKQK